MGETEKSTLAVTLTFDPETTKSKYPPNESGAVYSQVTMTLASVDRQTDRRQSEALHLSLLTELG